VNIVDTIKSIHSSFPWPHHIEICQARYDELRRALPAAKIEKPFVVGLDIYVNDEIPADEVHLMKRVSGETKLAAIIKITADTGGINLSECRA
jgi:hypothetical protein